MDEIDNMDLRTHPLTILQEGAFSFMSYVRNDGNPCISSITLKYNRKLYRFEISDIKVIAEEQYKELKE